MDIYLTADGERLRIPLLPDRLSVKMGNVSIGFQIIKKGEYKIPRGTALTGYSWNGVFPGKGMADASFVHDWQAPTRIISTLSRWMEQNKTVHIMVTETTINDDVFIENFVFDHFGVDNVSYTLTLTKYRPLYVTTAPPQPEVIIPEQAEEKTETKTDTKTKSTSSTNKNSSSTTKAQKTNTSTNTSPQKLSVSIPSAKSFLAAAASAVKSVVNVAANALKAGIGAAVTAQKATTKSSGGSGGSSLGTNSASATKFVNMLK